VTTRLVLLAFNEQDAIGALLASIRELPLRDVEVIVVDDGSTDGTAQVVQEMKTTMSLTLLRHDRNRGVAAAFDTGLRHAAAFSASADLVITMEGDGTSDPAVLGPLIDLLRAGRHVAIASRYAPGGLYEGFPIDRRIFSLGANLIMRWYCGLEGVKDYTIFYRGYRAELLQEAFRRYGDRFIEAHGFFSNIEMLVKLSRLRPLVAAETPHVYRYGKKRSQSKMRVWRNLSEYLKFFLRDAFRPVSLKP
jgi:dolichol-phosphate mannosyltransferase